MAVLFSSEFKPLLTRIRSNDPTLTELQLSWKKIDNRAATSLADALRTNSTISEVWLCRNCITGAGVGYLASALEDNATVTELYLGGNKIGMGGVSSIANLLMKNTTLTDLGLENNGICDSGGTMIVDALEKNSTLRTLNLNGNNIRLEMTRTTIKKLLKRNRDLTKVGGTRQTNWQESSLPSPPASSLIGEADKATTTMTDRGAGGEWAEGMSGPLSSRSSSVAAEGAAAEKSTSFLWRIKTKVRRQISSTQGTEIQREGWKDHDYEEIAFV